MPDLERSESLGQGRPLPLNALWCRDVPLLRVDGMTVFHYAVPWGWEMSRRASFHLGPRGGLDRTRRDLARERRQNPPRAAVGDFSLEDKKIVAEMVLYEAGDLAARRWWPERLCLRQSPRWHRMITPSEHDDFLNHEYYFDYARRLAEPKQESQATCAHCYGRRPDDEDLAAVSLGLPALAELGVVDDWSTMRRSGSSVS